MKVARATTLFRTREKYDVYGNRVEQDVTVSGVTTVQRYAIDGWNPAKGTPVGNENYDVWADLDPLHRRNLQVTSRMASSLILKQASESQVSIPLTGSVDGGFIAVALESKGFASPPFSDPQNNSSTPNLKGGQTVAVSDPFQFRDIRGEDRQCIGSTSTHVSSFWKDDGHPFHHAL